MKNKKILFLSPLPPPHYGSAMSSKTCLNILKDSDEFKVESIKLNYSTNMGDNKINLKKIKGFFEIKKQIRKGLKEFNPKIVYFVPATSNLGLIRDYLFIKEIKKKGFPILFHVRSRTIKNRLNNKIYRKMFSGEKAIVLGEQLISDVSDYIPKKDIFVLPNAIKNDLSENQFEKIMGQREKRKEFNILFLSNMDKTKGWPKLLEACKILSEKNVDFNCNFVGAWQNKSDENEFEKFIKEHNLQEKAFYLGKKQEAEKNKIFENSDVLVFPTEYKLETFGRVIIEAMMFGLPVIANGIASIPSIIRDKETGFILKDNSPEEIAEQIEILKNDKAKRINMGKEGRKRFLKHYEIKDYKEKFEKIIKQNVKN